MPGMSNPTAQPPDFDAYSQNFTLLLPNGEPFQADMGMLNELRMWGVRLSINYGSQIGASIILLLVLVVLTKREKRNSAIFIMNATCLIINAVRSILYCLYMTGNWYNPYSSISGDFSRVHSGDIATTIATTTITMILYIFIMASLSLQVWVVCITTPKLQRCVIMGLTTAVALIALGFRFAITIISNHQTMDKGGMEDYSRLRMATTILTTIAICVYSIVFTVKLGYALLQRRKLGMTQFGPMQVIFIMGCQTMVIPAIFSFLQFHDEVPELGSQTTTIVCIFLPLSAIWAGVIASDSKIGSSGADAHQRLIRGQFDLSARTSEVCKTIDSTTCSNSEKDSENPTNLATTRRANNSIQGVIHVDHEWSVEKGEASRY